MENVVLMKTGRFGCWSGVFDHQRSSQQRSKVKCCLTEATDLCLFIESAARKVLSVSSKSFSLNQIKCAAGDVTTFPLKCMIQSVSEPT